MYMRERKKKIHTEKEIQREKEKQITEIYKYRQ